MTGHELRATRLRLGLTQAELAAALGLGDANHVSRLERGRVRVSPPLALLLRYLERDALRRDPGTGRRREAPR